MFIARHKELGKRVAFKMPHAMFDKEAIERFRREGQTLAKLDHPNVVKVTDAGVEDGRAFLVMDYVEGQNLDSLRKSHPISTEEVISWSESLAQALAYIHGKNIIHRDVKSANIIINAHRQPVLVDFGIAKVAGLTQLTQGGDHFLGTFLYAGPELFKGTVQSEQSDIYSLGVVMYECLAGRYPFDGDTPDAYVGNVLRGNYQPLAIHNSSVPRWFASIVDKCLEADPANRFESAEELLDAVQTGREQGGTIDIHKTTPHTLKLNVVETIRHPVGSQEKVHAQKGYVDLHNEQARTTSLLRYVLGGGLVLAVGAVIWFVYSDTSVTESVNSLEKRDNTSMVEGKPSIAAPIEALLTTSEPEALQDMLREFRSEGTLTFGADSASFENILACYALVRVGEEPMTILSPHDAQRGRYDILNGAWIADGMLASLVPDVLLWIYVYEPVS